MSEKEFNKLLNDNFSKKQCAHYKSYVNIQVMNAGIQESFKKKTKQLYVIHVRKYQMVWIEFNINKEPFFLVELISGDRNLYAARPKKYQRLHTQFPTRTSKEPGNLLATRWTLAPHRISVVALGMQTGSRPSCTQYVRTWVKQITRC